MVGGVPHWLHAGVQHGGVRDHTGGSLLIAIQHAMDVLLNKNTKSDCKGKVCVTCLDILILGQLVLKSP